MSTKTAKYKSPAGVDHLITREKMKESLKSKTDSLYDKYKLTANLLSIRMKVREFSFISKGDIEENRVLLKNADISAIREALRYHGAMASRKGQKFSGCYHISGCSKAGDIEYRGTFKDVFFTDIVDWTYELDK